MTAFGRVLTGGNKPRDRRIVAAFAFDEIRTRSIYCHAGKRQSTIIWPGHAKLPSEREIELPESVGAQTTRALCLRPMERCFAIDDAYVSYAAHARLAVRPTQRSNKGTKPCRPLIETGL